MIPHAIDWPHVSFLMFTKMIQMLMSHTRVAGRHNAKTTGDIHALLSSTILKTELTMN
jgi:hypothetical protein